MPMFKISSRKSGADYGDYEGADPAAALDALAAMTGHPRFETAAAMGDVPPRDGLAVIEIAPHAGGGHA